LFRIIHISSFHRIHVDILHRVLIHVHIPDMLGMIALLPDLVCLVLFKRLSCISQCFQIVGILFLRMQEINNLFGSKRLELADLLGKILGGGEEMHMVFHKDIGMDKQAFMVVHKIKRIKGNLGNFRFGEQWNPIDHGTGDKIGCFVWIGSVSCPGHYVLLFLFVPRVLPGDVLFLWLRPSSYFFPWPRAVPAGLEEGGWSPKRRRYEGGPS
jgi:hypothetical protein